MIEIQQKIVEFLEGKSNEGLQIIANIFFKQINSEKFANTGWDKEELFGDFILKIFEKREKLLEIFTAQPMGAASYIREMVKNFLIDHLNSLPPKIENIEDYKNTVKDSRTPVEVINSIEAYRLRELIKEQFSDDEIILLCYMTDKECQKSIRETVFNNVSDDALYKRVERLKKKLAELVKSKSFAIDSVRLFLEEILPQICKERLKI